MSNLGLERFLQGKGLSLHRTPWATATWWRRCAKGGWNLGGEQSGHIVMTDYATTGDGLMAGCSSWRDGAHGPARKRAGARFEPVPQMLKNVRYGPASTRWGRRRQGGDRRGRGALDGTGRVLIRKSGPSR
jgi:phosphoglucosamine mutase